VREAYWKRREERLREEALTRERYSETREE
jgi:hypothetical protein